MYTYIALSTYIYSYVYNYIYSLQRQSLSPCTGVEKTKRNKFVACVVPQSNADLKSYASLGQMSAVDLVKRCISHCLFITGAAEKQVSAYRLHR